MTENGGGKNVHACANFLNNLISAASQVYMMMDTYLAYPFPSRAEYALTARPPRHVTRLYQHSSVMGLAATIEARVTSHTQVRLIEQQESVAAETWDMGVELFFSLHQPARFQCQIFST